MRRPCADLHHKSSFELLNRCQDQKSQHSGCLGTKPCAAPRLQAKAGTRGLTLMEAAHYRFHPAARRFRDMLAGSGTALGSE
eukprot:6109715-Amphidinium_carterae.1